jgi:hypothetical protein
MRVAAQFGTETLIQLFTDTKKLNDGGQRLPVQMVNKNKRLEVRATL